MQILVLEDKESRVRWLRRMFPRALIVWTDKVERMLAILREDRVWDLVLLDHDLNRDRTGMDAAREIRCIAPIVVWSPNVERAPAMVETLRLNGQNVVGWLPFGSVELFRYLRSLR